MEDEIIPNKENCYNLTMADSLFNLNACGKRSSKELRRRLMPKVYADECDWYDDDGNINATCDQIKTSLNIDSSTKSPPRHSIPTPILPHINKEEVQHDFSSGVQSRKANPTENVRTHNNLRLDRRTFGNERKEKNYRYFSKPQEQSDETNYCKTNRNAMQNSPNSNVTYWRHSMEPEVPPPPELHYYNMPQQTFVPLASQTSLAVGMAASDFSNSKYFFEEMHSHNQKLKDDNRTIKELAKSQFLTVMDHLEAQQVELERQDQELYRLEMIVQQIGNFSIPTVVNMHSFMGTNGEMVNAGGFPVPNSYHYQ